MQSRRRLGTQARGVRRAPRFRRDRPRLRLPVQTVKAFVDKAVAAVPAASLSAAAFLATAAPARADAIQETEAFLKAFWEFRTGDPTSFVTLTILPILGPYAIFQVLIGQKVERRKEELAAGGWDKFMLERGLNIDVLALPQLNAFAAAAEKGLLDDEMVREFVRQLELNEKWKSPPSTSRTPGWSRRSSARARRKSSP